MIITFDDGPDAVNTPKILDALAEQCVRATFFEIGRNAEGLPAIARREVRDGHTVAHHTWSHPQPTLRYLPGGDAAARADILKGMIAVEKAAYGRDFTGLDPKEPKDLKLEAPLFRFPGFADTQDLRDWFKANDVGIFGVDLWASDWIEMTPEEELKLVMSRLEKNGHKGMLLLHDNHPWTAAMVPMLLKELKAKGYRIVHMVGGTGKRPDRSGAARLEVGDRARHRRAEAPARQIGIPEAGARADPGEARAQRVARGATSFSVAQARGRTFDRRLPRSRKDAVNPSLRCQTFV